MKNRKLSIVWLIGKDSSLVGLVRIQIMQDAKHERQGARRGHGNRMWEKGWKESLSKSRARQTIRVTNNSRATACLSRKAMVGAQEVYQYVLFISESALMTEPQCRGRRPHWQPAPTGLLSSWFIRCVFQWTWNISYRVRCQRTQWRGERCTETMAPSCWGWQTEEPSGNVPPSLQRVSHMSSSHREAYSAHDLQRESMQK